MSSEFSMRAKRARAALAVPDFPLERILSRSACRRKSRVRTLVLSAAVALGMAGTAAAFAPNIYNGVRLWFSGNTMAVTIQSFAITQQPTEADLRAVLARATFRVVLPVGLPRGTQITSLKYAPAAHPDAVFLDYRNSRAKFNVGFAIFAGSAINHGKGFPQRAMTHAARDAYQWRTGDETVIVLRRFITAADADRIEAAMMTASQQQSIAQTVPMLSRALIVGVSKNLRDIAEKYQPPRTAVVIGPGLSRTIPGLAARRKPLYDPHTAYLTKIPWSHGRPDYANATVQWPRHVAVPTRAVRAIDAVLRRGDCAGCVILFNAEKGLYAIWEISPVPPYAAKKYLVDKKTLRVTAQ